MTCFHVKKAKFYRLSSPSLKLMYSQGRRRTVPVSQVVSLDSRSHKERDKLPARSFEQRYVTE